MLNISENSINAFIQTAQFKSYSLIRKSNFSRFRYIVLSIFVLTLGVLLFVPWTQNIQAKGYVTTRLPNQRPQSIQSVISGKLEKWYVKEGDLVKEGDTIAYISEVKNEYFDPELIQRTAEQVDAKSQSIQSYEGKIKALENQYAALQSSMRLKLEQTQNKILQTKNKIKIDSADLVANKTNLQIAENQLSRTQELHSKGLKSLTDLQEKELKVQESRAKVVSQENKLMNQRNELINFTIELNAVEREYSDKLAKSQSDRQSALSDKLESMANTSKLKNQLSNYSIRQQFYYITAPQSGYITKTLKKGIGEIIKEGSDIATIMPADYDLAVEIYVKPQDLPLLSLGNSSRIRFDGWPAIVISGWPQASTGVFNGKIVAIDQFINEDGYYRILMSPDTTIRKWPSELRVGAGANTFLLLKDVPIWYEIWRKLNGFPADYYKEGENTKSDLKRKAPIKSVK